MALIDTLLTGGLGQLIKDIIGSFKLSPEAKMEFEKELAAHEFELKKIDAELESKLSEHAAANIQAEEKSGDKYTARARPTFMYIVEFILLWNYVAVPLFKQMPVVLPEPLFWLFGSAVLGYTGARSWEKISGMGGK